MKLKLIFAENVRRVCCKHRNSVGFLGCRGDGCESWRWHDNERGYCGKSLDDNGAVGIHRQVEVDVCLENMTA